MINVNQPTSQPSYGPLPSTVYRGSLGLLTKTVCRSAKSELYQGVAESDSERSRRYTREMYILQKASASALPGERVGVCQRQLGYGCDGVFVEGFEGGSRFKGLMRCDSVWSCPVCAKRIGGGAAARIAKVREGVRREGDGCDVSDVANDEPSKV